MVPFNNDSRSSDSEKSSVIGSSKMPHVKSINCVQYVALKLIVGILFKHFLVDSPLLKEYKKLLTELLKNSNLYCFNNYSEIR